MVVESIYLTCSIHFYTFGKQAHVAREKDVLVIGEHITPEGAVYLLHNEWAVIENPTAEEAAEQKGSK